MFQFDKPTLMNFPLPFLFFFLPPFCFPAGTAGCCADSSEDKASSSLSVSLAGVARFTPLFSSLLSSSVASSWSEASQWQLAQSIFCGSFWLHLKNAVELQGVRSGVSAQNRVELADTDYLHYHTTYIYKQYSTCLLVFTLHCVHFEKNVEKFASKKNCRF